MRHAEYPHYVEFQRLEKESDSGGGFTELWTTFLAFNGLLDTPSSREVFEAQQLNVTLDRNFFYPYRTDVNEKMRAVYRYKDTVETYEVASRPQDQGGQHEVMVAALKLIPNG